MTTKQPLALRLADDIEAVAKTAWDDRSVRYKELNDAAACCAAAAELRRQHAENEALRGVANELVVKVKELCIAYNHPLPEATLARAGEKT